ncbi:MAG: tyrosine-type recombinase/integrase [Dactylosporangium sp.]|nr:tyrosine-type recombinase/integrase [Dactylosporangium sp.]
MSWGSAEAGALDAVPSGRQHDLRRLTSAWLLSKRSAHTQRGYHRDLGDWLAWCAERDLDPLGARMSDVDAWITQQRRSGGRNGRPAAESSIARRVSTVSSWYAYLVRNTADDPRPLMTRNPARTDARPRVDPDFSPTVGLDRSEVDRLQDQADADGVVSSALIRLLVVNGLRVGSALAAQIEDLGHDRGHRVLTVVVKRGNRRRVAIPPLVGAAIDAMLDARGNPAEGPLFVTPSGRPLYQLYVYRLIRRLARRAGIAAAERISPHSLRHTAITELLNASGGDLRRAQDFAHHADPRTTRRYDRARDSLDQHGAYLLASRFGRP